MMTLQQIQEDLRRKRSDANWCKTFPDLVVVIDSALRATTAAGLLAILKKAPELTLAEGSRNLIQDIYQLVSPSLTSPVDQSKQRRSNSGPLILPKLDQDSVGLNSCIDALMADNTLLSFMASQRGKISKNALLLLDYWRSKRMALRAMAASHKQFYQNYVNAGSVTPLTYNGVSTSIQALRAGTQSFISVLGDTPEAQREEALRQKMRELDSQLQECSTELATNPLATYTICDLQTHLVHYIYLDLVLPSDYSGRAALVAHNESIIAELFARLNPLYQPNTLLEKMHGLLIGAAQDPEVEAYLPVPGGYRVKAIDTSARLQALFNLAGFKSKHVGTTFVVQQDKSLWRYDEGSGQLKQLDKTQAEVTGKFKGLDAFKTLATTPQEIVSPRHFFGEAWSDNPDFNDWSIVNQYQPYKQLSDELGARFVPMPADAKGLFVYSILKYGTTAQRQQLESTIIEMDRNTSDLMCWIAGAQTFLPAGLFTPALGSFISNVAQNQIRAQINAHLCSLSTTLLTMRSLQKQLQQGYSAEVTLSMAQLLPGSCRPLKAFFETEPCTKSFAPVVNYLLDEWDVLKQALLKAILDAPAKGQAESPMVYMRRSEALFSKKNHDLLAFEKNSRQARRYNDCLHTKVRDVIQHLSEQEAEPGFLEACQAFREEALRCGVWTPDSEKSLFVELGKRATTKLGKLKTDDSHSTTVKLRNLNQEIADTLRDYFSLPQEQQPSKKTAKENPSEPYTKAFREFCTYYLEMAFKQGVNVWAVIEALKAQPTMDATIVDACFVAVILDKDTKVHAGCVPDDLDKYDQLLSQVALSDKKKRASLRNQMALAVVEKCSVIKDWSEPEFSSLQDYVNKLASQGSEAEQSQFRRAVALKWLACLTERYNTFCKRLTDGHQDAFTCKYEEDEANHLDLDCFFNAGITAFIDASPLTEHERAHYQTVQQSIARKYVELYCHDKTIATDADVIENLSVILGQKNFFHVLQRQLLWLLEQYGLDFKTLKPRLDEVFKGLAKFAKAQPALGAETSNIDTMTGALTAGFNEPDAWLNNLLIQAGLATGVMADFFSPEYYNQLIVVCRVRKVMHQQVAKIDACFDTMRANQVSDNSADSDPEVVWKKIEATVSEQKIDPRMLQSTAEYFVEQMISFIGQGASALANKIAVKNLSAAEAFTLFDKPFFTSFTMERGTLVQQAGYQNLRLLFARREGDRLLTRKIGAWLADIVRQSGVAGVANVNPQTVIDDVKVEGARYEALGLSLPIVIGHLMPRLAEAVLAFLVTIDEDFDQKFNAFLKANTPPVNVLTFFDNDQLTHFIKEYGSLDTQERYLLLCEKIAKRIYGREDLSKTQVNFDPLLARFPSVVAPRVHLDTTDAEDSSRDSSRSNSVTGVSGGTPVNPVDPNPHEVINPILAAVGHALPQDDPEKQQLLAHLRRFQHALQGYQRELLNDKWRWSLPFITDKRKKTLAELLTHCEATIEAVNNNDVIRAADTAKRFFETVEKERGKVIKEKADRTEENKSRLLRVLNEADCGVLIVDGDEDLAERAKACPTLFVYVGVRQTDGSVSVCLYQAGKVVEASGPLILSARVLTGLCPNATPEITFLDYQQRRAIDPDYRAAQNIAPNHTKTQVLSSPWWAKVASSRTFLDAQIATTIKNTGVSAPVEQLQPANDPVKYSPELVGLQRQLLNQLASFKTAIHEALRGYDGMIWDSGSKKARTETVAELTKQIDAISAQLHYQFTTIQAFEATAQRVKTLFDDVDREIVARTSHKSPLKKALQGDAATKCRQAVNPWVVARFGQDDGVQDLAAGHTARNVFEERLLACSLYPKTDVDAGGQIEVKNLWDKVEAETVKNITEQLKANDNDFEWGVYAAAAPSLKYIALKNIADDAQRNPIVSASVVGGRVRTQSEDLTNLLEKIFPKFSEIETALDVNERVAMQGTLAPLGQQCLPYLIDRLKNSNAFVWPVSALNIPVNTRLQALKQAIGDLHTQTHSLGELEALEAAIQAAIPAATEGEAEAITTLRQEVADASGVISDARRALYLAENHFEFPTDVPADPKAKLALLKKAVKVNDAAVRSGSHRDITTQKLADFHKAYAVFTALGVADAAFERDLIALGKVRFENCCKSCITAGDYSRLFDASFAKLGLPDQWGWLKGAWLARKAELNNNNDHLEAMVVAFKAQVDQRRATAVMSEASQEALRVIDQGVVDLGARWVKVKLKVAFSNRVIEGQSYPLNTTGQALPLEASWQGLSAALDDEMEWLKNQFSGREEADRASMERPSITASKLSTARVNEGMPNNQIDKLTSAANDNHPLNTAFVTVSQYLRHAQQALQACAALGSSPSGFEQKINQQRVRLGALSVRKALVMATENPGNAFYNTIMGSKVFSLDMCLVGFQDFLKDPSIKERVSEELKKVFLITILRGKGYPTVDGNIDLTELNKFIQNLIKAKSSKRLDPALIKLALRLEYQFTLDELFGLLNTIGGDQFEAAVQERNELARGLLDRLTLLLVAEEAKPFMANVERLRLLSARYPWLLQQAPLAKQATHWPQLIEKQLGLLTANASLGSIEFVKVLIDTFKVTTQKSHPLILDFDGYQSNKACMNELWRSNGGSAVVDGQAKFEVFNSSFLKDHYIFLFNEAVSTLKISNRWREIKDYFNASIATLEPDWPAMAEVLRGSNVDTIIVEALLPSVLMLAVLPEPPEALKKIGSTASMTPRPSFMTIGTRDSSFRYSSSRGSAASTVDLADIVQARRSQASSPGASTAFDERKQAIIALLKEGFNKASGLSSETRFQLIQQAMAILHGLCYVPSDLLPPDQGFVTALAQVFTETNPERLSVLDREPEGCQKICDILTLFQQHQCGALTQAESSEDERTDDGYDHLVDTEVQGQRTGEDSASSQLLEQAIQQLSAESSAKLRMATLFTEIDVILKGKGALTTRRITSFDLTEASMKAFSREARQELSQVAKTLIAKIAMLTGSAANEVLLLTAILMQAKEVFDGTDAAQLAPLKEKIDVYNTEVSINIDVETAARNRVGEALSVLKNYFTEKKWDATAELDTLRRVTCEPQREYCMFSTTTKPTRFDDYDFICVTPKLSSPAFYRVNKDSVPFRLENMSNLAFTQHKSWPLKDLAYIVSGQIIAAATGFYPEEMTVIEAAKKNCTLKGKNADEKISYYLMLVCLQGRIGQPHLSNTPLLLRNLERLKVMYASECKSKKLFYQQFLTAIEAIVSTLNNRAEPPGRSVSVMSNAYSTTSTSNGSLNGRDLRNSVSANPGSTGRVNSADLVANPVN